MIRLLIVCLAATLVACKDRFDEGYAAGYAEASAAVRKTVEEQCETKVRSCERAASSYTPPSFSSVTTEVCGGGGVTFNGKHYKPGKTGCVRVFSDGRVQRW